MTLIVALASVVVFALALRFSRLQRVVADALDVAQGATKVMRDDALTDLEKERLVKRSALHLLKRFVQITVLSVIVLLLPMVFLVGLDALNVSSQPAVLELLLSWEFIAGLTVASVVVWALRR